LAPIEAAEYQRIIDFLKALDNKLNKRALLYLIGGGAITLAYAPENRTADIILVLNFWIKVRLPIIHDCSLFLGTFGIWIIRQTIHALGQPFFVALAQLGKIKAVQIHNLGPGCREVMDKLLLGVSSCIDFSQGAQFGV